MAHYARLDWGDEDCPVDCAYVSADNAAQLAAIVATFCKDWERDLARNYPASDEFYAHEFRPPAEGETNYSQRVRIAGGGDWVLEVVGLTESEFENEPNGEQLCGQCEGSGTLQEGATGAGEMCPVCDGSGVISLDD